MTGEERPEVICKNVFKDDTCEPSRAVFTDLWISLIRQMEEITHREYR